MTMSDNTLVSDYGMCEEGQVARIAGSTITWIDAGKIGESVWGLTRLKVLLVCWRRASGRY